MATSSPDSDPPAAQADQSGERPSLRNREVDLRGRILEAATRLFAQSGFAATSMRDIAEAVACTKPALYYHFGSKGALFEEIVQTENERIRESLRENLEQDGPVRERLLRAMRAHFDYVRDHPHQLKLLMRAELHPDTGQPQVDAQSMREYYERLALRVLQEGVEGGELRPDLDLQDVLHVLAGAVDIRSAMCVMHGVTIPEDYPERVIALLFGGIGA